MAKCTCDLKNQLILSSLHQLAKMTIMLVHPIQFSVATKQIISTGTKMNHKKHTFHLSCSSPQSQNVSITKPRTDYKADGLFDKLFLNLFRQKMVQEIGWDSQKPGYDGLIEVANRLILGRTNSETKDSALLLLLPPSTIQCEDTEILVSAVVVGPVSKDYHTFGWRQGVCHDGWVTAISCQWLMGPCKVNSVELPDGKSWTSGVLVEKCKYLEESKCVGICINTCKLPTQEFFQDYMGVPLLMEPNFNDYSCQFKFGVAPPEPQHDSALREPCLEICPNASRRRKISIDNSLSTKCPKS
ncbi:isomerase [Lithospermum erythrorhizon]|uniref:Isomerase n=1 Tax=Lithospermum erythrorhizon TaxID=34254 RepID=A0AAV3NMU2_LITER